MKLSPYSYFEIKISFDPAKPESRSRIGDFLSEHGIPLEEIAFCETPKKTFAAAYTRQPKILKKIRVRFKKELGRGFQLAHKLLCREDWFDKWELHYNIMPLGKQFTLVPLWQKSRYKPSGRRIPIYLDPKGASGSGQHPATQIMVLFMEQIAGKFRTCLDLGTGTGILSAVASKLGAEKITAVDNDSAAVKAARFNLRLNGARDFEVSSGDVTADKGKAKRYDLVCANLISPVLDSIKDQLFASVEKGGCLAVSGIYIDNFAWFRKRFRHPKFRCVRAVKRKKWTGLLLQRR